MNARAKRHVQPQLAGGAAETNNVKSIRLDVRAGRNKSGPSYAASGVQRAGHGASLKAQALRGHATSAREPARPTCGSCLAGHAIIFIMGRGLGASLKYK